MPHCTGILPFSEDRDCKPFSACLQHLWTLIKCHCIGFLQGSIFKGMSIYISTLSLTAIALDRLEVVSHTTSINSNISNRNTVIKIIIINSISMLAILPYCFHMEVFRQEIKISFTIKNPQRSYNKGFATIIQTK